MNGEHFHTKSLDAFIAELKADGFEPTAEYGQYHAWRSAIHPAFAELTDASQMDIVIMPGWPFRPPMLFVQGLSTNHTTADGFVCMWQDEDDSREWTTLAGFKESIQEWCERAKQGWQNDNLQADAYLNFKLKKRWVATFNLAELRVTPGCWGECHGVVSLDPQARRVDIHPGADRAKDRLRILWFHVGTLKAPPPRQTSEVARHLSRQQRKGLTRALAQRRTSTLFNPSGGCDIVLFCWERNATPNLLALTYSETNDKSEAYAMLLGPKDKQNLILRAGPDAPLLHNKTATLFGAGALGGYTAASIAQSGLGSLNIIDGDLLLPGNIARHIAGHQHIGKPKATAVQSIIKDHAPWTKTAIHLEMTPLTPKEILARMADADIVIDTTGNAAFVGALAMVAKDANMPLVSGALYRGGAVGRVQRQALPEDTPINERKISDQYPEIPSQNNGIPEFVTPDTGCSAPVNNAPPTSVIACASRIAQAAIDTLTARFEYADEIIDVHRSLDEPPFDLIGNYRRPTTNTEPP